jgi:hypothetical protein
MSVEIYSPPPRTSKTDRGHKESCPWENNFSPSCDCDRVDESPDGRVAARNLANMMMRLGWGVVSHTPPHLSFARELGANRIQISKVASGWQYVWVRGGGMTILERGGFGTIGVCMQDLWEQIAVRSDQYMACQLENIQLRDSAPTGEEGSAALGEAKDAFYANVPPTKDWECDKCGVVWKVAYDIAKPRCIRCKPITSEERRYMYLSSTDKPNCPDCSTKLELSRSNRFRTFWACPQCFTEWYPNELGVLVKE